MVYDATLKYKVMVFDLFQKTGTERTRTNNVYSSGFKLWDAKPSWTRDLFRRSC